MIDSKHLIITLIANNTEVLNILINILMIHFKQIVTVPTYFSYSTYNVRHASPAYENMI